MTEKNGPFIAFHVVNFLVGSKTSNVLILLCACCARDNFGKFPMYPHGRALELKSTAGGFQCTHGRALELESTAGGFQCIRMGER